MLAAIALLTLASVAHAEDPTFVETQDPKQKFEKPETHLSAELGGAWATGNVVYYSVHGGALFDHRWGRNMLGAKAGVNVGRSKVDADGNTLLDESERAAPMQQNAKRYEAEARYDRFVGPKDSLYALAGAFVDPFAGYDLRSHEQLGYSRLLVDTEKVMLKTEIGADVAQENYVDGAALEHQNIYAARLLVGTLINFNENVSFADTFEVYENVVDPNDLRMLNTASLTSKFSSVFSLKLSHALAFDNVPVEITNAAGANVPLQKLDQTTLVTLVASIF